MYVTRRLSELRVNPEALSQPPEGPNSGYLVLKDEDYSGCESGCFGWFKYTTTNITKLPIPQNKDLTVHYAEYYDVNQYKKPPISVPMIFIPVLNQPLSSNTYYAIQPQGQHKGKALISSRERNKSFLPAPLKPKNVYQHVKIGRSNGMCYASSRASDGFTPYYLPRKGWYADTNTPYHFELHDARGVDSKLRACLPNFSVSVKCKRSKPVIVGECYVPFMFVKEGRLRDQVERSMYYHVTLEQRWEQIFTCSKNDDKGNLVEVDVTLEKQEAFIDGNMALWSEKNANDGVILFTSYETEGGDLSVGLRVEVVERMKWEQERGGWKGGNERRGKVKKVEEFKGEGEWEKFGCYILVERFNLRRMDGSLAMAFDFKHIHHVMTLWE